MPNLFLTLTIIPTPAPGPSITRAETWKALEDMQKEGKLKSIGVSNFGIPHLQKLMETARVMPAANQIELHPWLQREEVVKYCQNQGIVVQAYSPLVKAAKLFDPTLSGIAEKYNATPAQILIAWSLAKGFITLPKSVNPLRQQQNLSTPNKISLLKDDIQLLDTLEEYMVTGWDPIKDAEV
jgi:diketogulonate reductase-like aldo/keto reductase